VTQRTSPRRGPIIVFGLMFDLPYAGIVMQFLHYLRGLRALGWDVWYVEDSLSWPYDPAARIPCVDPVAGIDRVARVLADHGFGDRWVYRCAIPDVRCFGAGEAVLAELYRHVEVALNVTGAQEIRDEQARIPGLVYVQSDPFGAQVDVDNGLDWARRQLAAHCAHFTFGELVGTAGSVVPTVGFRWFPTRQPVALELWPVRTPGDRYTTVTTWRNDTKHRVWRGDTYYWTKDREFLAFVDLPRHTSAALELAIDGMPEEAPLLQGRGWHLVGSPELAVDVTSYRDYILASRGEFTVARDQFVRPRTGWFSDRSACYLAAGRPVVTQDTGFGEVLPTGRGLFAFSTVEEAASALAEVEADPGGHAAAARAIAEEYFSADKVLASLLDRAGL
jgi:hypothetical protein